MHMVFINLVKAYDKVPRNVMFWALHKHKVSTKYITLIKYMHDNVVNKYGDINDFLINIELQWSTLSPYLFALVMDEVTRDIQGGIPLCMLFADDVIWYMRVGRGLTRNWSYEDKLWRQNILCLVGLKWSI
jgi:hypothetical protein